TSAASSSRGGATSRSTKRSVQRKIDHLPACPHLHGQNDPRQRIGMQRSSGSALAETGHGEVRDRRNTSPTRSAMGQLNDRFEVQVVRDATGRKVRVKFRGRVVRTLTG